MRTLDVGSFADDIDGWIQAIVIAGNTCLGMLVSVEPITDARKFARNLERLAGASGILSLQHNSPFELRVLDELLDELHTWIDGSDNSEACLFACNRLSEECLKVMDWRLQTQANQLKPNYSLSEAAVILDCDKASVNTHAEKTGVNRHRKKGPRYTSNDVRKIAVSLYVNKRSFNNEIYRVFDDLEKGE